MKNTLKALPVILLLALTPKTIAQTNNETFINLIGIQPTVEINLGAMMLGLLSSATQSEEQGISNILKSLDMIKVTVFELENDNKIETIKAKINSLANLKTSSGYEKLATIKEDDSLVYILAKMDDKNFKSLSIYALDDDDELILIDIDGTILLSQLGELMKHFDVNLDINSLKLNNSKKK